MKKFSGPLAFIFLMVTLAHMIQGTLSYAQGIETYRTNMIVATVSMVPLAIFVIIYEKGRKR